MSKNKELPNAEKIIERFGGIRPMASKIDVPVTTVQGWKKRDVIPAARRQLILEAANVNNIDLSDLVEGASSSSSTSNISTFKKPEAVTEAPKQDNEKTTSVPRASEPSKEGEQEDTQQDKRSHDAYTPLEGIKPSEQILAEIEATEKKAFRKSIIMSLLMSVLVLGAAAALLWPEASEVKSQVAQHSESIEGLEQDVAVLDTEMDEINENAGFLKNIVPADMQEKFEGLQNQARNLQNTFAQMGSGDTQALTARVQDLETKVTTLLQTAGMPDIAARLEALEQTVAGREQLSGAIDELRTIVDGLEGRMSDISAAVPNPQDSALGQTLEGVKKEELQAAVMLIAFGQLRDSLNREAPFEEDLALLQKLAGDDNEALQEALMTLAPHADGGVLTVEGLSNEFKGLAGDVVVASVSGEDVSIADKAKARFSNMLKVEKDGEVVNGTETQAVVSKAQAMLDDGDVEGAVALLQTLEGPAADEVAPFIDQAQITMLAQQVQVMVRDSILSKIPGAGARPIMLNSGSGMSVDSITNAITGAVKPKVVTDEESGLSVLPQQNGFKGLSSPLE